MTGAGAELTRVERIFDPASLVAAVPGHGTVASRLDADRVTLSCAKSVDNEARALILLVPDVVRVDVCPYADSIGIMLRLLATDVKRFMRAPQNQQGWRVDDEEVPASSADQVRLYAELPDVALLIELVLRSFPHAATQVTHMSARTLLTRIDPSQMQPVEPEK